MNFPPYGGGSSSGGHTRLGASMPFGGASRPAAPGYGQATIFKAPMRSTMTQPELNPTTIYVGNITERYQDYSVAEILSACGSMLNWKRVKGADFKLQGFGFCEYERPEGAARASRLLNQLLLGNDRKLVIKIDAKTQQRIDLWLESRGIRRLPTSSSGNGDNETPQYQLDEKSKAEDKSAMEQVAQIIMAANKAADEADATRPTIGAELPKSLAKENRYSTSSRNESSEKSSSKSKQHSSSNNNDNSTKSPRSPSSQPQQQQQQQQKSAQVEPVSSSDTTVALPTTATGSEVPQQSITVTADGQPIPAEPVVDEEEAAERRRAERRARDKAERYAERLKAWQSRERDKGKQYARIKERENDSKRRKEHDAKRLKQLLEDYDDLKDDAKFYRGSALAQRLRDREREIEADARDRRREREEMEDVMKKLRQQAAESSDAADVEAEIDRLEAQSTEHLLPRLSQPQLQTSLENNASNKQDGGDSTTTVDINNAQNTNNSTTANNNNDEGTRSESAASLDQHIELLSSKLLNSADGDRNEGGNDGKVFVPARFEPTSSGEKGDNRKRSSTTAAMDLSSSDDARRQNLADSNNESTAAAGGDESQGVGGIHHPVVKIAVNKSKRLGLVASAAIDEDGGGDGGDGSQNHPSGALMARVGPLRADGAMEMDSNKKERIQQLIKSIPSAKEDLFAFELDWGQVDKLLIDKRVRPWIDKKIVEYIGEAEVTLSEFLCQKVLARTAPEKILEDIGMIFDEDSELFVIKLWRLLVYETEARKQRITQL